jgi:diaminopimelate decarboxylase
MLIRDARGAAMMNGQRLEDVLRTASAKSYESVRTEHPPRTPAYVYDLDAMVEAAHSLIAGFEGAPHLVAYAVKANTAGPIIKALNRAGCGAEVVSGSELMVALGCGISAESILFSGVAKTNAEIDQAIGAGDRGILALQIESVEEVPRVVARARALGRKVRVSIRVNPDIIADTHAHVATGHDEAKFGVAIEDLEVAYAAIDAAPDAIELVGLGCHIGSQLTKTDDYVASAEAVLDLVARRNKTRPLAFVDFGGGFGVDYGTGCPAKPADFARTVKQQVARNGFGALRIVVEPGRCLVAAFGVLCASVVMTKASRSKGITRRWMMIDAGMNDLVRPAMYGAKHRIEPIDALPPAEGTGVPMRVVGPVCESSDDFGEHPFSEPIPHAVVIRDAGAYGFVMASEYNGRGLPAEIFLSGGKVAVVNESRSREAWAASRIF